MICRPFPKCANFDFGGRQKSNNAKNVLLRKVFFRKHNIPYEAISYFTFFRLFHVTTCAHKLNKKLKTKKKEVTRATSGQ